MRLLWLTFFLFMSALAQTASSGQTFQLTGSGGTFRYLDLTLKVPPQAVSRAQVSVQRLSKAPLRLPLPFGGPAKSRFLVLASHRTRISDSYQLKVTGTLFRADLAMALRDRKVTPAGQTVYSFAYVWDGQHLELWSVGRDGEIMLSPLTATRLNALRNSGRAQAFFIASLPKVDYVALCQSYGGRFLIDTCQFQ